MWLHISLISLCGVLTFATKAAEIQGLRQIVSAELGASVSLQCSFPEKVSLLYWYKQSIGMRPQLLVTVPKYGRVEFHGEYKDNPRFTGRRNTGGANLNISNTIPADTAVYYCAQFNAGIMNFGEGTLLVLPAARVLKTDAKSSYAECSHHTILQKPLSYQGHLGDSVNFHCIIHTNASNAQHSVYWFRPGSGESHPGIIYTHGNRSDECKKSSETDSSTQSCVYKLPKRNLSLSDAGTYYCAVAACGQILFGKGSNLKVEERCTDNHLVVYSLSATLALFLVLIVVFLVIPINISKTICCQRCKESSTQPNNEPPMPKINVQEKHEEDSDALNYAALSLVKKKAKGRRKAKAVDTVVVYSSVRCKNPQLM